MPRPITIEFVGLGDPEVRTMPTYAPSVEEVLTSTQIARSLYDPRSPLEPAFSPFVATDPFARSGAGAGLRGFGVEPATVQSGADIATALITSAAQLKASQEATKRAKAQAKAAAAQARAIQEQAIQAQAAGPGGFRLPFGLTPITAAAAVGGIALVGILVYALTRKK